MPSLADNPGPPPAGGPYPVPERHARRTLLIDFGGTLFRPLGGQQWATAAAHRSGTDLSAHDRACLANLLDTRFHHVRAPGRDLSAAAHRRSMLPALESLVHDKALAASLYDFQFTAEFWQPRCGARDLLRAASERGIPVIVVSNVPWDIRPIFTRAGLADHVRGFALSCEVGAEKPDKHIFQHGLSLARCAPAEAVFVGDDPVTDSGALHLGIPVILIPPAHGDTDQALHTIARWLLQASQPTGTNETSKRAAQPK